VYRYIYKAVNADGKPVTQRIEAPSHAAARQRLEALGYTEISFVTDELQARLEAEDAREHPEEFDSDLELTAGEEAAAQMGGCANAVFIYMKYNLILWIPLGLWVWFAATDQSADGWDWLVYSVAGAFFAYTLAIGLPCTLYDRIQRASVRGDWRMLRFWTGLMASLPWVTKFGTTRAELNYRKVEAQFYQGDREGALERWRQLKPESGPLLSLWHSRYGQFLATCGRLDEAAAAVQKAFEIGERTTTHQIDLAHFQAVKLGDIAGARKHLEAARHGEIHDLAKSYIEHTEGAIALEENDPAAANEHFETGLQLSQAYRWTPLIKGHQQEIRSLQVIALARCGRFEDARKLFRKVEPFLLRHQDEPMRQRCRDALAITR